MLKTAIIGCGNVARSHAEVITKSPDYHLAALYDVDFKKAMQFAAWVEQEFEVAPPHVAHSFAEVLANPEVEVLALCTPSGIHLEHAEAALEHGKHLIIEKPIDVDLARAQRFEQTAAAFPHQVVSVIFQHRFDRSALIVKDAIDRGLFGRITSITANVDWWRPQAYYDSAAWRGTWALDGGGALINQSIHTVDLVNWFAGCPESVLAMMATSCHEGLEVEDVGVAILRHRSGALTSFHGSTSVYPDFGVRIQVHGDAGGAIITNGELTEFHSDLARSGERINVAASRELPLHLAHLAVDNFIPSGRNQASRHLYGPHNRQYADVARAITEGIPPTVGISEGIAALVTVKSMYLSAVLGQLVPWRAVAELKYEAVDLRSNYQAAAGRTAN